MFNIYNLHYYFLIILIFKFIKKKIIFLIKKYYLMDVCIKLIFKIFDSFDLVTLENHLKKKVSLDIYMDLKLFDKSDYKFLF